MMFITLLCYWTRISPVSASGTPVPRAGRCPALPKQQNSVLLPWVFVTERADFGIGWRHGRCLEAWSPGR